jgi:hypothetical protein
MCSLQKKMVHSTNGWKPIIPDKRKWTSFEKTFRFDSGISSTAFMERIGYLPGTKRRMP